MRWIPAAMVPVYVAILAVAAAIHADLIYSPLAAGRDAVAVAGLSEVRQAGLRRDRILELQERLEQMETQHVATLGGRDARVAQVEQAYTTNVGRLAARVQEVEQAYTTDVGRLAARAQEVEQAYTTDVGRLAARVQELEQAYTTDVQNRDRLIRDLQKQLNSVNETSGSSAPSQ